MSNKIKLQYPFNTKWNSGYLVINSENRKHICLVNNESDRTTTSYARYLLSVHLGRFLESHEHVDHIDNDKTNDVVTNLQILSQLANNRKSSKGRTMVDLICPICDASFSRLANKVSHKNNPCCSKQCGYIKTSITLKNK